MLYLQHQGMKFKLLGLAFALFLLVCVDSNTCGGNCPLGDCALCPCGTSKKIVSSTTYCKQRAWDQDCCKCIIYQSSRGN
jgi:hypothetical protein